MSSLLVTRKYINELIQDNEAEAAEEPLAQLSHNMSHETGGDHSASEDDDGPYLLMGIQRTASRLD
jgi:hypothetical protein